MQKTRNKKLLSGSQELNRQKQMLRLMQRYVAQIWIPNTWILPYVWTMYYTDHKNELQREEFVCPTNNIVFACMIFEAQKLPVTISVIDATLSGYEEQFSKMLQ